MITPRTYEVRDVVKILESEEYADTTAMAKALLKMMADLLALREQYAVPHRFKVEDTGINYGPFFNRGDASRFAKGIAEGETGIVSLFPPKLASPTPAGRCECGHARELHQLGYCAVILLHPKRICGCKGFESPKEL